MKFSALEQIDDKTDHIKPIQRVYKINILKFVALGKFILCFVRLKMYRAKVPRS